MTLEMMLVHAIMEDRERRAAQLNHHKVAIKGVRAPKQPSRVRRLLLIHRALVLRKRSRPRYVP